MPYLRFTKDRRGYENTFLVHPVRVRGREQTRVLYWFRTPPHVKVGRAALDEDVIAALEAQYPEIDFDWDRILEAQPPPAPEPDEAQRFRHRGKDRRREPRRPDRRTDQQEVGEAPSRRATPRPEPAPEPAVLREPADAPPAIEIQAEQPPEDEVAFDAIEPAEAPPTQHATEPSAAERRLGPESLERVRARYAQVLARIHAATLDSTAGASLVDQAERLNPDGWVTPEEVSTGLEHFEEVLAEISRVIGPPRRRTRRGGRRNRGRSERPLADGTQGAPPAGPTPAFEPPPAEDGGDVEDDE